MRRQFLAIAGEGLFEGHGKRSIAGQRAMHHGRGKGRALRSVVTTAGRHPAGIGRRDVLAPARCGRYPAAKGNSNRDSMAT
jgi:hypothetical protein